MHELITKLHYEYYKPQPCIIYIYIYEVKKMSPKPFHSHLPIYYFQPCTPNHLGENIEQTNEQISNYSKMSFVISILRMGNLLLVHIK